EFICTQWTSEPERFKVDPIHLMPGLNTLFFQSFDGSEGAPSCGYPMLKAVDDEQMFETSLNPARSIR
ncbi:hypothetical protein XpopCFBP1817_20120, partial [Xanthomonas populi]